MVQVAGSSMAKGNHCSYSLVPGFTSMNPSPTVPSESSNLLGIKRFPFLSLKAVSNGMVTFLAFPILFPMLRSRGPSWRRLLRQCKGLLPSLDQARPGFFVALPSGVSNFNVTQREAMSTNRGSNRGSGLAIRQ